MWCLDAEVGDVAIRRLCKMHIYNCISLVQSRGVEWSRVCIVQVFVLQFQFISYASFTSDGCSHEQRCKLNNALNLMSLHNRRVIRYAEELNDDDGRCKSLKNVMLTTQFACDDKYCSVQFFCERNQRGVKMNARQITFEPIHKSKNVSAIVSLW